MAIQWLELPGEIRMRVYHELFCSTSITLHQNLETRKLRPQDRLVWEKEPETRIRTSKNCTVIKDAGPHDNCFAVKTKDVGPRRCSAILETCKAVRSEAAPIFYAEAHFTIEHGKSYNVHWKHFEIDQRIAHLTIEQSPGLCLWPETIDFLERHFRDGGFLRELKICKEGFDQEYDDELGKFLKIVLPHVDEISFRMNIWLPMQHPAINGRSEYDNIDRQVTILRHSGICIETARRDDFESLRDRLTKAGESLITQHKIRWIRSAD